MALAISAPYYTAGRSQQRWHQDQRRKGLKTAAAAGAAGAALYHPKTSAHAVSIAGQNGYNIHPAHAKSFGQALGFAAAGAGAYAGVHHVKGQKIKKRMDAKSPKAKRR